ncbi:MAG: ABC transporter substrate-binding protein [Synergistaceae bacterium]|jgi:taurine transport system substrate-binding protein|nr:ABC transporter substrate-binding protein [Synergistaceae bacterium]
MKTKIFFGVSVALSLFALASSALAASLEKIVIGYQNIPNDEILAIAEKWHEKELGVPVEFKQFDSGRDVNTAFVAGGVDVALIGTAPVAVGISTGVPYDVFWIHDVIGSAESLAVRNSSGIKDVAGIAGHKIAVPFASTAHYSLLAAIEFTGLSQSQVTVIDLQPQDILAAWQRGDIDGAYVWHPTLGNLLKDGTAVTDSAKLAKQGALTADLGVVSRAFADKYPEFVTKYVKTLGKAVELYREKPDEAAAAIAKQFGITKEEALDQAGQLIWLLPSEQTAPEYLGVAGAKGKLASTLKSTADFLVNQKSIESAASLEDFEKAINTRFIEEASK